MAELGIEGDDHAELVLRSWCRPGTPAPVVDRLAAAAHAALTSERVRTHFEKVGTRPMLLQKAEMIPFIEKEIEALGRRDRAGGAGEAVAIAFLSEVIPVRVKKTRQGRSIPAAG